MNRAANLVWKTLRPGVRSPAGVGALLRAGIAGTALLLVSGCGGAGGGAARVDTLVSIRTTSLPRAIAGVAYAGTIDASGPNPPLTWLVTGGRLPPGLDLDSSTGAITGYPRVAGRFRISVDVRDGADAAGIRDAAVASDRTSLALDVDAGPLTILPFPVPPLEYARAAVHRFEAAGGEGPYRFTPASSWPEGIALAPDGTLAGAPSSSAGVHLARVRVTDATGRTSEREVELRVVVVPLSIGADRLTDAATDAPYEQTLRLATPGAGGPHHWSLVASGGMLPPGLTLDADSGRIAGTATVAGTFTFRVEVDDALGQVTARDVALRVNRGPVLAGVAPASLPATAASVTLFGAAFQPGMRVSFGTAPLVPATVIDATHATVVPPVSPRQSGLVPVRLLNPDGGSHVTMKAFRYPFAEVIFVGQGVKGGARDHSRGIAAGDVDGDGLADLAHVGSLGIEIIRPSGPVYAGAWTTKTVRSDGAYNDVRLADVDADGDLDLVASRSSTTDTIEVYRNDGSGGFPSTASVVTPYARPSSFHYPFALATGDVDGDGVIDIAFTSGRGNQGTLWIYRGLGDGSFVELATCADSIFDADGGCFGPNSVSLSDLDRDGRDDIVLSDAFPSACAAGQACPATGGANAHPGGAEFVAWTALSQPSGVPGAWRVVRVLGAYGRLDGDNTGLAVYDHDGDGRRDLAVFGGYLGQRGRGIAFLTGDGLGRFDERVTLPTALNRRFGAQIDANLDGFDDLLVVGGEGPVAGGDGRSIAECWLGGRAQVPERAWSSGSEQLAGGSIPGSNPGRVVVADFDGDGLDDFAVDQSFHAKERFPNGQGDGTVEGVAVWLNRSR